MSTEKIMDYIKANPGATKANISEASDIKGLQLHNFLSKLVREGQLIVAGQGNDATYDLVKPDENTNVIVDNNDEAGEPQDEELTNETAGQDDNQQPWVTSEESTLKDQPASKAITTRNNDKYSFMGQELGKGPLCRELIRHIAQQGITFKKLKEMFPDDLIPRFGVFQDVERAREISGQKYDRYFFKESYVIKLKDKNIVCTNQLTLPLIEKIIARAKELGYEIK